MTKAIIFDIFGVISETFNQKWMHSNVVDRPDVVKELQTIMFGLDTGKNTQEEYFVAAAKAVNRKPEEIRKEMESGFKTYPGMFELAGKLKGKYKTAICSNSLATYVRPLFKSKGFDLTEHFEQVFISSEVQLMKPEPEIFKYCADKIGVKIEECAFIDDAKSNILAAESLGMLTHHFTDQKKFEFWLAENKLLP